MNILYVEDDKGLAALAKRKLEQKGYSVSVSADLSNAREVLNQELIDCVLIDYRLPDGDGLELISERRGFNPAQPWIMITGVGNESLAVEAMKRGATDYLVKDLEASYLDILPSTIQRAFAITKLAQEKLTAEQSLIDARDQLRSLFDASIDLMVVCDKSRQCLEISEQALVPYSVSSDDFIGKDILGAFGINEHADALDRLKQGRHEELKLNIRLGGHWVPMRIRSRLLNDKSMLMCFRDMREHQALRDARKTVDLVSRERDRLAASSQYLSQELKRATKKKLSGTHRSFNAALELLEQAAQVDATVLVTGETGTGKELAADLLHDLSPRAEYSIIKVNCAALPTELVESELFGHLKGAFTGAFENKIGRFEAAHKGTLVLDEIGEFPLPLQAKLLRALQSGEFQSIGSNEAKQVDVRVVGLTNRDLLSMVKKGKFREDLYYRLNVIPVHLPALRERGKDIRLLFETFIQDLTKKNRQSNVNIPDEVYGQLNRYDWPGNIRELRNYVERGLAINDWTLHQQEKSHATDTPHETSIQTLAENEKRHIIQALYACKGVISGKKGAAAVLDINPNTLRARMEKLGIKASRDYR